MSQPQTVEVSKSSPVTTISICRPHSKNALDAATLLNLRQAFLEFDQDPSAAVGVIYGKGGAFCAGADLKQMSNDANYEAWAGTIQGWLGAPLSKPLIAAVEGHAVAGGLGLALYCDMRVCDETAVFGVFCRRFGVPMSDGTTVRLPRLIGEGRALDMMLTGRPVHAGEALQIGLATMVVDAGTALGHAQQLALELASFPQTALRSDRLSVLQSRGLGLDAALRNEAELAEHAKQNDAKAGARRFNEGAGRHGEPG